MARRNEADGVTGQLDLRAALAAALKRQVRDAAEWPIRDRRRFRNLMLDASSSDAMPLAELLLRVHDDGLLRGFPDRRAGRAVWDTAIARLTGDLQAQRFLDAGIARYVAEAWASALGPDELQSPRTPVPRATPAPRAPIRSSAPVRTSVSPTSGGANAASLQAYRRSNAMFMLLAAVVTVLTILAFRSTGRRGDAVGVSGERGDSARTVARAPEPAAAPRISQPRIFDVPVERRIDSAPAAAPVAPSVPRADVPVGPRAPRASDDIVLTEGRVIEGSVVSVRQQSVVVKDATTGLEFEIARGDIDRIVTRDGRVLRFGEGAVPLVGDGETLTAVSRAGRYRVAWSERWGTERRECSAMARQFAPGAEMVVQHLRGAPMLRLAFVGGQGFNASVRSDGLFESTSDVSPRRGPQDAFVSTRLSGKFGKDGALSGVARITAVQASGAVVCDAALTLRGVRTPG